MTDKIAKRIAKRTLNKLVLSNDDWDLLERVFKDMWYDKENENKSEYTMNEICGHFNLKKIEYKALKKYYWGELK